MFAIGRGVAELVFAVMAFALAALPTVPQNIAGMECVHRIEGSEALMDVDKLHGKKISAQNALVATYKNGDREAKLWVSVAGDAAEARRQIGEMVHLMFENPKSPFKNPKRINRGDVAVYRFFGMGQAHLMYSVGAYAYWISLPVDAVDAALDDLLPGK